MLECLVGGRPSGLISVLVNDSNLSFLTHVPHVDRAGTVMHKNLRAGERLLIDTDSLVAFENSCSYEIRMVDGGCAMMCCGGMVC